MKKRIIAIVILVFVVAAGALLAWQYTVRMMTGGKMIS